MTDLTGLPVPGASITLVDGATVIADAEGRFCIASAPVGPQRLTADIHGFRSQQLTVDVRPEAPATVTFRLAPGFADSVVVTATRTERRLDDVPVRTEVVTRETIDRLSARTLADAMEFTTGVRVEVNCGNCNFSQIRLLGLEGPYTQILVDGQPIVSSLAQVYGIEQLPARMIDRIEVVKGGGSALYGPGSVGGVVNVISRDPTRSGATFETRTELVAGVPSYLLNGAADWVDDAQQTFVTLFAQSDRVKPLDLTGDSYTEVSRRNLDAAGVRFGRYALANRAKLTIDAGSIAEDRRGGDFLRLPPHEATIAEAIQSRRRSGSVSWFHSLNPRFDYRATVALAATDRDSYYGTGRDPHAYGRTDNLLSVVDTQLNHYAGRHTLSWGVQASWESLTDAQPAYGRFTDVAYSNAGLFAQDDWAFGGGWQVVYGIRADRHSAVDGIMASPRAALMYSPQENLDIRVSAAHGFRAPQVFDEDLHLSSVGGEARIIHPDPALRHERSVNYMAGAEWKPVVGRGQALVEVNVFRTRLDDLFHVGEADDPATGELEFLKTNRGGGRVYGLELNLGWGIEERLIVQGGIVEQRARFTPSEPDFGSLDFFRTPRRYGNLTLTWKHPVWGDVFGGVRYTGPMRAPHYAGFIEVSRLERTPAFLTFDAAYARTIASFGRGRLTLTVNGRNLTNQFQPDVDQGPLRDAAYVYGPRFPRSVAVGLRAEL